MSLIGIRLVLRFSTSLNIGRFADVVGNFDISSLAKLVLIEHIVTWRQHYFVTPAVLIVLRKAALGKLVLQRLCSLGQVELFLYVVQWR